MTTWVLIWWIMSGGTVAGGQQEFDTHAACLSAFVAMGTVVKAGSSIHGVCVPKGDA